MHVPRFQVGSGHYFTHRCILAARCSSFHRIFSHPGNEGTRVPDDILPEAVTPAILHYLYTGIVLIPGAAFVSCLLDNEGTIGRLDCMRG